MEALFDTCKQMVIRITQGCLSSEVYAEECLKLARYVSKVSPPGQGICLLRVASSARGGGTAESGQGLVRTG